MMRSRSSIVYPKSPRKNLALLDPERQAAVREIINYPEGTVGRIMTTDFMALSSRHHRSGRHR